MTSLKTSIKTITYLSDTGCLEIQGASLPAYETRVSQAKKILQSFAPNDIKVDTNTKFISLIESVRALSPELQCKVLDGLNYAKNTLHNINQNSAIATKSSCQSTESIEKTITFNILDMLDNLTMRQQNIMEAFLRVFTSMYNASAKADASMSIVFEQLVHLQSSETKNASWANFAGALAGSAINATGAVFMAGAELAKPAGKIDDIAENQEQNTDKPDSQTRIKSKEDMANAKARLAEIENQQKDLSNNKNIEDNDKQEQSSKLQKEKESITNKIKDKEKINSHNLRYGITSSISHTNNLFQSIANLSQYGGTVAAEHTRAEKDLAEQAKNVMHSVMSSYLDQINRDVQGRDQALNLLQQIIQTIIDTDSAIVQGIRS
ncbi:hypothetical protein [Escherichia coli]|nr:hypothetical protein [Escherichia coli]MDA5584382.1 hypothetical protein [Escherichia coli]